MLQDWLQSYQLVAGRDVSLTAPRHYLQPTLGPLLCPHLVLSSEPMPNAPILSFLFQGACDPKRFQHSLGGCSGISSEGNFHWISECLPPNLRTHSCQLCIPLLLPLIWWTPFPLRFLKKWTDIKVCEKPRENASFT